MLSSTSALMVSFTFLLFLSTFAIPLLPPSTPSANLALLVSSTPVVKSWPNNPKYSKPIINLLANNPKSSLTAITSAIPDFFDPSPSATAIQPISIATPTPLSIIISKNPTPSPAPSVLSPLIAASESVLTTSLDLAPPSATSALPPTLTPISSLPSANPSLVSANPTVAPLLSAAEPTSTLSPLSAQRAAPTSATSDPLANQAQIRAVEASTAKKTAIAAGSVGTAVGLSVLLALALLIARKRSAMKGMERLNEGDEKGFTGLPVSTLLFTRKASGRNLSLGSTATATPEPKLNSFSGNSDPFAGGDDFNELGQLSRESSRTGGGGGALTIPSAPSPVIINGGSIGSTISVASYPYLGLIDRTNSIESDIGLEQPLYFDAPQKKESWENFNTAQIIRNGGGESMADIVDRGMRPTLTMPSTPNLPTPKLRSNLPFALPPVMTNSPFTGGLNSVIGRGTRIGELHVRNPSD